METKRVDNNRNDKKDIVNGAIQIQNINKVTKLSVSENVSHIFEIFKKSNPYLSIHDGNSATYKIGVREKDSLFRIVSMKINGNVGNPDSEKPGISMTKDSEVGIGTNEPQERLHVIGNLKVEGDIRFNGFRNSEQGLTNCINTLYQEIEKLKKQVAELEKKPLK